MTDVKRVKLMMNTKMSCRYMLDANEIVEVCKNNEWYTCGDMVEYAEMLAEYDARVLTADELKELAIDICIHSDYPDDDLLMFPHVMEVLANKALKLWYAE